MRFFSILALLCLLGTAAAAQVRYFPNGSFSADTEDDKFVAKWFSEQLAALRGTIVVGIVKDANPIGFYGCGLFTIPSRFGLMSTPTEPRRSRRK